MPYNNSSLKNPLSNVNKFGNLYCKELIGRNDNNIKRGKLNIIYDVG